MAERYKAQGETMPFADKFKLRRFSRLGNPLEKLASVMGFEMFRPELESLMSHPLKSDAEASAYYPMLMFKGLITQRFYNIGDDDLEYQIIDRTSFRKFLGLPNGDSAPDAKTFWSFDGYTKHYFEGSNRICSRIGGGFSAVSWSSIENRVPELDGDYESLFNKQNESVNHTFDKCLGIGIEADDIIDLYDVVKNEHERDEQEPAFFYHSDHLGSAAYLTNDAGQVTQTLNYLPYGEDWVDVQNYVETRYPRLGIYTYNGKEKDYESGFHYYGGRYYWSELLTSWFSVDPMMDKYPSLSPYNYCAWNPVKLIDSDGRMIDEWRVDINNGNVTKVGNKGGSNTDYYSFGATDSKGSWIPDAKRSDVEINRNQSGGTINSFRVKESKNSTLSVFHIPDEDVNGFFLERGGPDTKESGKNKRIPEGEFGFINHKSDTPFKNNRAKLTSDKDEGFVDRAILIHSGNYYYNSEGCLLPGTGYSKDSHGDYQVSSSGPKTNMLYKYISNTNKWNVKLTITNRL